MTGNTHRLLALASLAGLDAVHILPHEPGLLIASAAIAFVTATLPDVDIRIGVQHRTITHALIWPAALLMVGWPLAAVAGAALLSHILADAISDRVQMLWPLPYWIGIRLIKTGGFSETIFVVAGVAAFLAVWIGPKVGFSIPDSAVIAPFWP